MNGSQISKTCSGDEAQNENECSALTLLIGRERMNAFVMEVKGIGNGERERQEEWKSNWPDTAHILMHQCSNQSPAGCMKRTELIPHADCTLQTHTHIVDATYYRHPLVIVYMTDYTERIFSPALSMQNNYICCIILQFTLLMEADKCKLILHASGMHAMHERSIQIMEISYSLADLKITLTCRPETYSTCVIFVYFLDPPTIMFN